MTPDIVDAIMNGLINIVAIVVGGIAVVVGLKILGRW
jgi:hypothetical protein